MRYNCVECKGGRICHHGRRKDTCLVCSPSNACQHCKHISIIGGKWKPYCFRCYCVLHPDAIIPRRFKLKETHVTDRLKEVFGDLTMIFDKRVEGGCSKRRPDVFIDFGSHCIVVEIDENRHANYICEERRLGEIYEDIGLRNVIFLRFNPDGYTDENKKRHRTPFCFNKDGTLLLNQREFNHRMDTLVSRIQVHRKVVPTEPVILEYLFYGPES